MRVRVKSKGVDAIKELMEIYNLKQKDLWHLIGQSTLSELLSDKKIRKLTYNHINKLRKFFNVSADVFFDD